MRRPEVVCVPTQRLEDGVEEFGPAVIFFVVWGQEDLAVGGEPLNKVSHQCGRRSSHTGSRIFCYGTKSSRRKDPNPDIELEN
jgi:hypothetical protein